MGRFVDRHRASITTVWITIWRETNGNVFQLVAIHTSTHLRYILRLALDLNCSYAKEPSDYTRFFYNFYPVRKQLRMSSVDPAPNIY